jgi:ankyrin repeat protein
MGAIIENMIQQEFERVVKLIESGLDINHVTSFGNSILMEAINNRNIMLVKYLLEQPGIDVNIQNKNGDTALMYYISENLDTSIFDLLLNIKHINIYIKEEININLQNCMGYNAIMIASNNSIRATYFLKKIFQRPDVDVSLKNNEGYNFIHYLKGHKIILLDYDLQKNLLYNGREDILLFLDKYNLIHSKIRGENLELFNANTWGLI